MVEAAGVELFGVLITRKLLILGIATTAKTAPLPDPLYVYCTKMLFALEFNRHHMVATVSHKFSEMDRNSELPVTREQLRSLLISRLLASVALGGSLPVCPLSGADPLMPDKCDCGVALFAGQLSQWSRFCRRCILRQTNLTRWYIQYNYRLW